MIRQILRLWVANSRKVGAEEIQDHYKVDKIMSVVEASLHQRDAITFWDGLKYISVHIKLLLVKWFSFSENDLYRQLFGTVKYKIQIYKRKTMLEEPGFSLKFY